MFEPIVTMTFHEVIEEGESSFTIEVPKSYGSIVMPNLEVRHRQFYFSDLYFIPGFYKQKAAQLGLEQEENTAGLIDFQFRMSYTVSPDLYKNAAGTEEVRRRELHDGPFYCNSYSDVYVLRCRRVQRGVVF